jgi:hypothetical protein
MSTIEIRVFQSRKLLSKCCHACQIILTMLMIVAFAANKFFEIQCTNKLFEIVNVTRKVEWSNNIMYVYIYNDKKRTC